MPSAATVKKAPGRPRAFTRDDILDCAMELLDRDGADALSLRAVARRLGTVLGTLYNYFDNLADLEDEVAARLIAQLPHLDPQRPEPVREQLLQLGLALIRSGRKAEGRKELEGALASWPGDIPLAPDAPAAVVEEVRERVRAAPSIRRLEERVRSALRD